MHTYEFKIFEGNKILWVACGNALFWAMLLAFAATLPDEVMLWAVGAVSITLIGSTIFIFRQLNMLCRFEVYSDKLQLKYLSAPFGVKKTDRIIPFNEIISYSFSTSGQGDMIMLKLNRGRGWVTWNRSQYSKGEEVFKELVGFLEESITNYNLVTIAKDEGMPIITKGKGFFESTGGKIYLSVLILLTIGFTVFIFTFEKEIKTVQMLKLIAVYLIMIPLTYRAFFNRKSG